MSRRIWAGPMARTVVVGALVAGCASGGESGRVDDGTFTSSKGYRVGIPHDAWQVERGGKADLELKRTAPPGGMLVDATCDAARLGQPLPVLARHLTFGLTERQTLESDTWTVAGRPAAHRVVQGERDGAPVTVEAVVLKGQRCVHDFLYVASPADFEGGRRDFKLLVESFAEDSA